MKSETCNSMMTTSIRAAAIALFGLFGSSLAAQDYMGPLDGILPDSGLDGVWQVESDGQSFGLENIQSPGDIRYYYAGSNAREEGQRRIDVELTFNGSNQGMGMGGILYGLDPNSGNYFIFGLESDGSLSLYRRDDSGILPMTQTNSSAIRPGSNTLTLIEHGNELSYQINGQALGSIANDHTGRGRVGIAVAGLGKTVFHRFSVSQGQVNQVLSQGPSSQHPQARLPVSSSSRVASTSMSERSSVEFKPVEIMDESGPFGRQVAMRTLVPANWETKGGVMWGAAVGNQACFRSQRLVWGAGTPDQSYGIAFMDPINWGANNFGQPPAACIQRDLPNAESVARAYLQLFSEQIRTQITQIERPPEVEALIAMYQRMNPPMNLPNARQWFDGVAVEFTSEADGVRNDGIMILISSHGEGQSQNAMGTSHFRIGHTELVLVLSTPPGQLEAGHPAFGVILNNIQPDPRWQQAVAQWHGAQRPAPGQPGGSLASTSSSSSDSSIGDMMFESWQRRNGMNNAGQQRSIDGIREVQPWQTSNGTVRLSQNYNHAWELQNGNLVLTNNANFNPMQTFNQFGEALRRAN